jgi:hypothetical protein
MMLSDKELTALRNLAAKQAGQEVDWINIADARALTELGLARRNRGGWEITAEGLALIKGQPIEHTVVSMVDPQALAETSANEHD